MEKKELEIVDRAWRNEVIRLDNEHKQGKTTEFAVSVKRMTEEIVKEGGISRENAENLIHEYLTQFYGTEPPNISELAKKYRNLDKEKESDHAKK